jgi:hypothetical protein
VKSHWRSCKKHKGKRTPIGRSRKRKPKVASSPSSSTPPNTVTHPYTSNTQHNNQTTLRTRQSTTIRKSNIHTNEDPNNIEVKNKNEKVVRKLVDWELQEKRRTAISYIYESQYHSAYLAGDINFQTGDSDGIVITIAKILKLDRTHYNTVKKVCEQTCECLKFQNTYTGERESYVCPTRTKIKPDSFDMHFLTCLKERGASFKLTAALYNTLIKKPDDLPPIGLKAIYNSIKKSNHKVSITQSRCQATDRNLAWKQARFNAATQLLVRFGKPVPKNTSGAVVSDPKTIDIEAIKNNKLTLTLDCIGWWDEKHIPQVCGEVNDITYQFGRDENGLYDEDVKMELQDKVRFYCNVFN